VNTARPLTREDLSSAARLRLSALELYAERGEHAASIRDVGRHAGVAPGLVRHHFGSKDGLTRAVDDDIIDLVRATLEAVPLEGTPLEISAARDAAFQELLQERPLIGGYLAQALTASRASGESVLDRLVDLSAEQTRQLIDRGLDPRRGLRSSVFTTVVRQVAVFLVAPVAERAWNRLGHTLEGASDVAPMPPVRVVVGPAPEEDRG